MHRFIIVAIAFLLTWTPTAWAQAGEGPQAEEDEWEEYEAKYVMTAAALPLIVPSLGHLYAGDWKRSSNLVGIRFLFIYGFNYSQAIGASTQRGRAMAVASLVGLATSTIWECRDAYRTAVEWNEGEYEEIEEADTGIGLNLGLSLADHTTEMVPQMLLTLRWF